MSDFFRKLLNVEESQIETGFVDRYLGKGKYRVNMSGVKRVLRSAVKGKIGAGERVVINRKGQDRYIIGATQQLQTRKENEIIVD